MFSYHEEKRIQRGGYDIFGVQVLQTQTRHPKAAFLEVPKETNYAKDPSDLGKLKKEKKFNPKDSQLMQAVFKKKKRAKKCACCGGEKECADS